MLRDQITAAMPVLPSPPSLSSGNRGMSAGYRLISRP